MQINKKKVKKKTINEQQKPHKFSSYAGSGGLICFNLSEISATATMQLRSVQFS